MTDYNELFEQAAEPYNSAVLRVSNSEDYTRVACQQRRDALDLLRSTARILKDRELLLDATHQAGFQDPLTFLERELTNKLSRIRKQVAELTG
jgi:hypothetical protein